MITRTDNTRARLSFRYPWPLLFSVVVACGGASGGEVVVTGGGDKAAPESSVVMDEAEDRRVISNELLELTGHHDSQIRFRVAQVLGRIGDPAGLPALITLAEDGDQDVSDMAMFSLALFGDGALDGLPLVRAALPRSLAAVDALGKLGEVSDGERLVAIADSDASAKRRARAARALGVLGQRKVELAPGVVARLAKLLSDENESVRFMAAFALFRSAGESPGPAEVVDRLKTLSTDDPSDRVRGYSLRALARRGGLDEKTILSALKDEEARVSAQAVSSIAMLGGEDKCRLLGVATDRILAALEGNSEKLFTPYVHVARAATELLPKCPGAQTEKRAESILRVVDGIEARPLPAGISRIKCLGRFLAGYGDLALVACDSSRPYRGKRMLAKRLASEKEDRVLSIRTLSQMIDDPDARVATTAVSELASVEHPDATREVLAAVSEGGANVCAAALDGIAANVELFTREVGEGERVTVTGVISAIGKAIDRFGPLDHASAPLISAVSTLGALGDPAGSKLLDRLVADTRSEIRWPLLDAYLALKLDRPRTMPPLSPPRPFTSAERKSWLKKTVIARVRTTQGEFGMRLLPSIAPGTVSSFVSLVSQSYFNETEIHRVVPNFVVQAGDPSGTGLGDPGYNIRCEVSDAAYERGTVGMALAGKDTGGSQFFIALSSQPHLDSGYTVFGKVTTGMDVVDMLEEGDSILAIYVDVEEPETRE